MIIPDIKVFPTPQAVAQAGAERFIHLSEAAIEMKSRFSVALSGGSTPRAMFEFLATPAIQSQVDWPNVDVFFVDERCVPPEDRQSNFRMARESLLSKVPIPGDNIYRMRAELKDPNEAAKEYGLMLQEKFDDASGMDLIFLGMGDDGHTASLFPNSDGLNERKHRCIANFAPMLKSWRITLSAPFINLAQNVIVTVCGEEKSARVAEVLEGPRDPQRLPIQLIQPASGKFAWLMDVAAAGMTKE